MLAAWLLSPTAAAAAAFAAAPLPITLAAAAAAHPACAASRHQAGPAATDQRHHLQCRASGEAAELCAVIREHTLLMST